MNLYATGLIVVAAACALAGLQHLLIALRVGQGRVRLLFAFAALAVAVDSLVQRRLYASATPDEFEAFLGWTALSICASVAFIAWFIAARTGAVRRWLLIVETVLLAATAALDFVVPGAGSHFLHVEAVRDVVLPWGEEVSMAVGTPPVLRLVGDAANLGFLVLLLDTTLRLVRRKQRREVWLIGGSLLAYALSVLVVIPMDLGLLALPSVHPFAFLLIVAAMSWDLSDSVAREARLSREVKANERRWQQLLDNVQLLVVGIDCEGRITSMNPYAEQVSGYSVDEISGRHHLDFAAEEERDQVRNSVDRGLRGEPEQGNERLLRTREGEQRIVQWRGVVLRRADGEVDGLLYVGADVTEHRVSEKELRRTAAELERTIAELERFRERLEEENLLLRSVASQEREHGDIVGSSDTMKYVLDKVRHVAPTGATVLVIGETGVGKELVAREVHRESRRAVGPFVAVNCAALPPGLIESELFGHERGAFTGAERLRRGRFELASGGTLFLDEVGDLPLEVQPKLLRVLEEGRIQRVGGDRTVEIDVRLIAATNRDLRQDVDAGRFREDLFYRLEVYPITIPPLRERMVDLPELVGHFARLVAVREGVRVDEIPPEVLRHLARHSWPGNVRELRNVVERAVLRCTDGVLRLAEPVVARASGGTEGTVGSSGRRPTLDDLQRSYILEVVLDCNGRVAGPGGAAEILDLHPNTLRSRMQKLGITTVDIGSESTSDRGAARNSGTKSRARRADRARPVGDASLRDSAGPQD